MIGRNVSPVTGLAIEFQGLSTSSPGYITRRVARSLLNDDNTSKHGNNEPSNSPSNAHTMILRRHSLSHVTRDLTAAPQKRQRSVSRSPSRGRRASSPPPASPLTLPESQVATSPAAKKPRNPAETAPRASPARFSMILRGTASAAFKPTVLETFKTPTTTRRISVTTPSSLRVPSFSLSPAARTPTMRTTTNFGTPLGASGSSTSGISRLSDVTPTKSNCQTTPRTSHTMSRRQTMDALLFKSPLSPAEYSSPVLKRRRSSSRAISQSPVHSSVSKGKQVTTRSRPGSVISPQDDGSRDSGVCVETGGGAMSPIPFGLISPDLDQGEVMNQSFSELASKPISSRRTLFGTCEIATKPTQGIKRVHSFNELAVNNTPRSTVPITTPQSARQAARKPMKTAWRRHHSDSEAIIKSAINRAESSDDLVGDYSRVHSLPTTEGGKHADLKYISPETLSKVVTKVLPHQDNDHSNTQYAIIDCRYPYEYDGGHIAGALNLYTKDQVNDFLTQYHNNYPVTRDNKVPANPNTVLIFHCEFSSERGPKMAKFIRSQDRLLNAEKYPKLSFPEIYMAEGGYKQFYHLYPTLCTPQGYIPMLHENHTEDLRQFRIKSRSWSAGERSTPAHRRSKPAIVEDQSPSFRKCDFSASPTIFREKGRKLRL